MALGKVTHDFDLGGSDPNRAAWSARRHGECGVRKAYICLFVSTFFMHVLLGDYCVARNLEEAVRIRDVTTK